MRERMTYANVTATLALFLALGLGGAYAASKIKSKDIAKSAVTSKAIKDKTVTGKDIKDLTVTADKLADGSVSAAKIADGGVGAAKIADGAVGSAKIADGSVAAGDFAPDEAYHVVGAAGEPGFGDGVDGDCIASQAPSAFAANPVSFYRDRNGIVHLAGIPRLSHGAGGDTLCDSTDVPELLSDFRLFTLPPGYRPANPERFTTSDGGTLSLILIGGAADSATTGGTLGAGSVILITPTGPGQAYLDGLSFRAAGTGGGTARIRGTGADADADGFTP